jgi:alkylation response protein AidB-like acyl-CoA dehydrogenase
MSEDILTEPVDFLKARLATLPNEGVLRDYQAWWEQQGRAISEAVDRQVTPHLRMFDRFGERVDEILFPPEYREMLLRGYRAGVVWRAFDEASLLTPYLLGYVTSFYDPGVYCPHIVSLSTAVPLSKYGRADVRQRFLPSLLRRDDAVRQGATWMTEARGGSDLGAGVETVARLAGAHWLLTGDKYFASNVGAELAVVAARPEGAPPGVRGLALFLVSRRREDGGLNYFVRRLKNKIGTRSVPTGEVELRESQADLLGQPDHGVYLILETLNLSRVGNCIGSVALTQRALAEAWQFAQGRVAFGQPIARHPLLRRQFEDRWQILDEAFALAWEAVLLLNEAWRETPRYSEHYHLMRLVTHLAKYWTAEVAVHTAKWAMEVHGGAGVLAEYPVERLLREAMILPIWEGTPHRQILDGMEVMERKQAHRLLFDYLVERGVEAAGLTELQAEIEGWLARPAEVREAEAEGVFRRLAEHTACSLCSHR